MEGASVRPAPDFVAIKVLKPSLAFQPNRLAQFRREAERASDSPDRRC